MSTNDKRKEQLKELHRKRTEETDKKIEEAIARLLKNKEKINFNSVAKEAGVTKATLYNKPEIRERIDHLREQQKGLPTPRQMKREMDEQNKDAVIASLKRQIKQRDERIKELEKQLKQDLGAVYDEM